MMITRTVSGEITKNLSYQETSEAGEKSVSFKLTRCSISCRSFD